MAQVLERDPAYITSADIFKTSPKDSTTDTSALLLPHVIHDGPIRTVAHRGSEMFVAMGNELRWTDLGTLQDADEDRTWREREGHDDDKATTTYKVSGEMPAHRATLI